MLCTPILCFAKTDGLSYEYNITGEAIAKEGYYLVNVSVTVDKKKEATIKTAKQYALLGCLHKGFIVDRILQKPLLSAPLTDKDQEKYVNNLVSEQYDLFTNSEYPLQIVKIGKKHRVDATILVAKDALRQNLEDAGIIRKLGL